MKLQVWDGEWAKVEPFKFGINPTKRPDPDITIVTIHPNHRKNAALHCCCIINI